MRHLLVLAALVAAFVFLAPVIVRADDPIPRGLGHPTDGFPHWYDGGCCSNKDCEPVEAGAIVETATGFRVKYRTSRGFIAEGFLPYGSTGIKQSKDGQEHACATQQLVICIYIHFGA